MPLNTALFRNLSCLLLLMLIGFTSYSQMPDWKKSLYIGSGMTVGGAGALAGGSYMLAVSVPVFFGDNDDEEANLASIGLLTGGCILAVAGTTFTIVGPFVIKSGLKAKREERNAATIRFTPIHNKMLDRYQCSMNSRKFATISVVF